VLGHVAQDLVAPGPHRGRVSVGVEGARGSDLPRQRGRLVDAQALGRHAEEGLGREPDAVGTLAEVDLVDVALEQLVLGILALELAGVEHLPQLAEHGAGGARVVQLGQLLGDRAPALGVALGGVQGGPEHRRRVDTAVGVEVGVLGGEHGVDDVTGQRAQRHRVPLLGAQEADLTAVGGEHPAAARQRLEVADGRGQGRGHDEDDLAEHGRRGPAEGRDDADDEQRDQAAGSDLQQKRAPAAAFVLVAEPHGRLNGRSSTSPGGRGR
jgi:hypothetical protein